MSIGISSKKMRERVSTIIALRTRFYSKRVISISTTGSQSASFNVHTAVLKTRKTISGS